ncbi:conserved hypothetical protein [Acidithiobacillus caldus SM-1]|uniref:Uncharacterized protein n=2 Tax=Acidithiobacillus caldus TaxID=33059 RepID=F9ZRF8_ACICS|nr:conserved hypothetical protein [Acidithiobacillus caldus SM-1]AIA56169.1 hypothetical protein Acaty_c2322 [Acidithiobacillus caldus ATCC 51756]QER43973.1 hypothetical protein F0726_00893 [Acidithiobacillus caldus]
MRAQSRGLSPSQGGAGAADILPFGRPWFTVRRMVGQGFLSEA